MTSDEFGDIEQLDENLRKWFKEKWVRFGPDGKIRGACARGDDSEGKPKCLPQKKAHALGKKGRKYAAAKKRREDPNPERRGKAKNVATKKKSNEEIQVNEKWSQKYKDSINCSNPKGFSQKAHCAGRKKNEDMNEGIPFNQCPECRGPIVHESMINEKKDACYHKVKARYKVWPSAYASGALVQCRKKGASNWGTGGKKNESSIMKGIVDESENVLVLYIDGKPSTKYAKDHEAKSDMERLQAKFPNKKFELKREMREGVIIGHDANDPDVAVLGGAGSYKLSNLKRKAQTEANELAKNVGEGKFKNSAYNVKQLANTLNTIAAAEEEMEKNYFGEAFDPKLGYDPDDYDDDYEEIPLQTATHVTIDDISMQRGGDLPAGTELKMHKRSSDPGPDNRARFLYFAVLDNGKPTRLVRLPKKLVKPITMHEDYTGEFAAEKTAATNPYGGQKDRQFRGAISETPTDNPTGASGEGGWRKYKPKPAGTLDESRMHQYNIDDAIKKVQEYHRTQGSPHRGAATRLLNALYQWHNTEEDNIVTRAQLLRTPNMGKQAMALLDTLLGNISKDESPYDQNKNQAIAIVDSLKQALAGDDLQSILDLMRELKNAIGTMHRLSYKRVREDTAYAGGMGQGGNAGESYRKFKPKSAGTFKEDEQLDEKCWKGYKKQGTKKMFGKTYPNCVKNTNEEQLDEKCWDSHKQVGMKKKGDKMVPNCVPKESAIMKGLKR